MTSTRPVIEANRRGKREQIIEAAKQVLARDGLAACTARAVADASPLTKSAVHYYFDDIRQIIDLAMREHVSAMVAGLRQAADRESEPEDKLWAVVETYQATFAAQPNAAYLWFEYWIDAGRRRSGEAVAATMQDMRALLAELVAQLPVDDAEATAHALLSWLLGSIVQQQIQPRSAARLRAEMLGWLRSTSPGSSSGSSPGSSPE
jgi:AcrR family transcriptional regulator